MTLHFIQIRHKNELGFVDGCLGEKKFLHEKIKGDFIKNSFDMARCNIGLQYWSATPTGKILTIAQGNGTLKREKHAKADGDSKMNNRIKIEKK